MKSKAVTYILIVSVMAVWGIIFYRIFLTANADEATKLPARVLAKNAIEDYRLLDTASLVLDYRDPFLGKMESRESKDTTVVTAPIDLAPVTPPKAINWDFIKYSGFIVNPATKNLVSIIQIHNKEEMMEIGSVTSGVKLLSNHKDSVRVSFQGKTKYIMLK